MCFLAHITEIIMSRILGLGNQKSNFTPSVLPLIRSGRVKNSSKHDTPGSLTTATVDCVCVLTTTIGRNGIQTEQEISAQMNFQLPMQRQAADSSHNTGLVPSVCDPQ